MHPPGCRWRFPRTPATGSSRNSHAPTMHWILAAMMPPSDGEKVAPNHHALDDVLQTVLLDRIQSSWWRPDCWSSVFTTIPRVQVACESGRGTPVRLLSFLLQIENKRLHHIQTEISV
jgi:hypothetical protein